VPCAGAAACALAGDNPAADGDPAVLAACVAAVPGRAAGGDCCTTGLAWGCGAAAPAEGCAFTAAIAADEDAAADGAAGIGAAVLTELTAELRGWLTATVGTAAGVGTGGRTATAGLLWAARATAILP
jgi:hypothetical protein